MTAPSATTGAGNSRPGMTSDQLATWLSAQPAGYQVDVHVDGPLSTGPYIVTSAETADDPLNPGQGWIVLTLHDSQQDERLTAVNGEFSH